MITFAGKTMWVQQSGEWAVQEMDKARNRFQQILASLHAPTAPPVGK